MIYLLSSFVRVALLNFKEILFLAITIAPFHSIFLHLHKSNEQGIPQPLFQTEIYTSQSDVGSSYPLLHNTFRDFHRGSSLSYK